MMQTVTYSIVDDTLNGRVLKFLLLDELEGDLAEPLLMLEINFTSIIFYFDNGLEELDVIALNFAVNNHTGDPLPVPKIMNMVSEEVAKLEYFDIDYTIHTNPKLHPEREFIGGELQKTQWYRDETLDDKILIVENVYARDPFGSADTRETQRCWVKEDGSLTHPISRHKKYSELEQIKEGKRRRGNIVDGIQLPIMKMMIEVLTPPPYLLSQIQVLMMGRDFLDRHEDEFNKFVKNSSTVTDFTDPNFGMKSVVVKIIESANTTDTWLKLKPLQLDPTGQTSIEDHMITEFTI